MEIPLLNLIIRKLSPHYIYIQNNRFFVNSRQHKNDKSDNDCFLYQK